MLVGRNKEKNTLLSTLRSDKSEFVAVFGRRRVGKTYLVQETFRNSFAFVHTGLSKEGMKKQLAEFRYSLETASHGKPFSFRDWPGAFHALQEFLDGLPKGKKVVFIDEMPWMDTARSGFVSALEHFWNGWANFRRDIVLVVCGSATSWIINKVINDHGGLHNRVTRQIRLRPFTLAECEALARRKGLRLNRMQILEGYMVMGGIPFYWDRLQKGESVAQGIDRLFVARDAEFADEFDRLYASLFKKPGIYIAVVTALAARRCGKTRDELIAELKVDDNGAFSKALRELEECGFVARLNAPGRRHRDGMYQLVDNYTLFYFKFLHGTSRHEPGNWLQISATQTGRIWCGFAFERVCLAHIAQMKRALGISGVVSETYAWRHFADGEDDKGAQIDLVIDRNDGVVNLCEMKYTKGRYAISSDYAERLVERAQTFADNVSPGKAVFTTMVTPSGIRQDENSSVVQSEITADDLFAD